MPKDTAVKEMKKADPILTPRLGNVEIVRSDLLWGEVPGDKLVIHWDDNVHSRINYLDEDLFLHLVDTDTGESVQKWRVNFLVEKEMDIEPGRKYLIKLEINEKFHMGISTTAEVIPPISFIREGIDRYMITWGELNWKHIKREVERQHKIDWEEEANVALRILRYEGDALAPEEEWRFPGLTDMDVVGGKIKEISLLAVRKDNRKVLKEIFRLYAIPGKVKEILDQIEITPPSMLPNFQLMREVRETDRNHLLATWDIPDIEWEKVNKYLKKKKKKVSDFDTVLKLYYKVEDEWSEFDPNNNKKVYSKGNWFFPNVPGGTVYHANIVLVDPENLKEIPAPVIISNEFYIPAKDNQVVLIPIDENRIFAYWHLNTDEVYKLMKEKHDAEPHNIKTYIKIYHDYDGGTYHQPHLDKEFSMDHVDSHYLAVDPDKIYRAQIIAVADGWKMQELTPISNPVQTGRETAGRGSVNYVSFPQPQDHPTNRPIESIKNTAGYSVGQMILHLHAHLPFIWERINYGTSGYWRPGGYVEEWYHEAMRETYVPLVRMFDQLLSEGVDFKLSMDISPTLCNMMRNPVLQEEFLNYIDSLIALAKTEVQRTARQESWYLTPAKMHLREFLHSKSTFLKYDRDLTKAFKKFQDLGKLEILTCGATHGFLPLMGSEFIETIRGQIKTAVLDYEDTFGRRPYGIWLPECAYTPGIEKVLEEFGIRYFFSETHTIMRADTHVEFGVHAPVYIRGSQVAVFARDPETGKQVWSGDEGYPGDPDYLEFHLRGGPLKYNRITDRKGTFKQPYVPEWADSKASSHAQHFVQNRNLRFDYIKNWFWKKPIVVATYDAELFGHHWYEGPRFLYYMFKKMYYDQNQTELTTPSHYLAEHQYNQEIYPTSSSWGDKGTFDKWMVGSVSWMYRHMNDACEEMINLAGSGRDNGMDSSQKDEPGVRILSQMARELLLSQNSDAGFNISNGNFADHMKKLYFNNLNNFWILANMFVQYMRTGKFDEIRLRKTERSENIFPVIDPFVWVRR